MKRITIVAASVGLAGTIAVAVAAAGPTLADPQAATEKSTVLDGNVTLAPPPDSFDSSVSAGSAALVASEQFGVKLDQVNATVLASFSWVARPVDENDKPIGPPLYSDVPVWLVSVNGVCSQVVPETGECLNSDTAAVVDATTGEFVMSFPATSIATEPYAS